MDQQPQQHPVVLYELDGCAQCRLTRRKLDEAGIPYQVVNLADDQAALNYVTHTLGHQQAPIVEVAGHDHWAGFRPDKIDEIARLIR